MTPVTVTDVTESSQYNKTAVNTSTPDHMSDMVEGLIVVGIVVGTAVLLGGTLYNLQWSTMGPLQKIELRKNNYLL